MFPHRTNPEVDSLTLPAHILGLIRLLILLAWPLPLAIAASRRALAAHAEFRSESWLCGALIWIAAQTGLAVVLGTTGLLRPGTAVAAAGLAGLAGAFLLRRDAAGNRPPGAHASRWPAPAPPLAALLLLTAGCGLVLLWQMATRPSLDPDTLNYHLPAMAEFVQHGRFVRPPDGRLVASYPFGWEALGTLLLLPFGEDFLSAAPNLVAWATLALAIHLLARLLGASRAGAMLGASLVVFTPHLLGRLDSLQVDVAFAAVFVAAGCAALLWRRRGDPLWLAMVPVCGGLLAGFRLSGGAYWLLSMLWLVIPLPGGDVAERPPRLRWAVPAGVAAALLLGGTWYLRNLLELGNLFGHMEIAVAGHTLFPGRHTVVALGETTIAHALSAQGSATWGDLWTLLASALGWPLYALLGLTGLAFAGSLAGRARRRAVPLLALTALALATGLLYAASPFSANPGAGHRLTSWSVQAVRYAYPGLALLGAAAGVGAARLRLPAWALAAIAAGVALWGLRAVAGWREIVPGLAAAAVVGAVWRLVRGRASWIGRAPVALILLLALGAAAASWPARRQRESARHELYGPGYTVLEELAPAAVGVAASTRLFMYYGRELRRRVVDLGGRGSAGETWLEILRAEEIPVLAVGPVPRAEDTLVRRKLERLTGRGNHALRRLYAGPLASDIRIYALDDDDAPDRGRTRTPRPARP